MTLRPRHLTTTLMLLCAAGTQGGADTFINDNLTVNSFACIGGGCLEGGPFSSAEVNLSGPQINLLFDDTSSTTGRPNNDWEILINEAIIGGDSFFSIQDVTAGETVFRIDAGAGPNALRVDEAGSLGLGTPMPRQDIHIRTSDTPVIRFEQDGTSVFPEQTFDIGANEEGFFIIEPPAGLGTLLIKPGAPIDTIVLDTTGHVGLGTRTPSAELHIVGTETTAIRLEHQDAQNAINAVWEIGGDQENYFVADVSADTRPFRIRPGAPTNALFVDGNGQVGVGLQNPKGALHVRRNQPNNVPHVVLQNRREGGRTELWFQDRDTATDDDTLRLQLNRDVFNISFNGTGGAELQVTKEGDVRLFRGDLVIPNGGVIVGGRTLNVPDYVFAEDYELMPLSDVAAFIDAHSHLPHIPSAAEVTETGLDMVDMQLALLRTVEEQTLYILQLQAEMEALKARLD